MYSIPIFGNEQHAIGNDRKVFMACVFSCFVDFSKAFDKVDYWKLFCQMIDDGSDVW